MSARRLLVLAALALPPALVALAADGKKPAEYKVVRVVDGDTIVIDLDGTPTKVRLIGLDTPETVDPRKPVQAFGKEASAFTKKLLEGKSVSLEYDQQKTDKYKRTLAYVYLEVNGKRVCVNRHIIAEGYGFAYTKYPFDQKRMDDHRAAEREARENKRGMWSDEAQARAKADAERAKEKPKAGDDKAVVYVTKSGTKYHADGCRSLAKSKIETTLGAAKERGCGPCALCNPPR